MLHDYEILDYSVDIIKQKLTLNLKMNNIFKKIIFNECIAHQFEYPIPGSIILDIELVNNINKFIDKKEDLFKKGIQYNWPIAVDSLIDLKNYLFKNNFQIYTIYSSYGLTGWVLAKGVEIIEKEGI